MNSYFKYFLRTSRINIDKSPIIIGIHTYFKNINNTTYIYTRNSIHLIDAYFIHGIDIYFIHGIDTNMRHN